MDNLKTAILCGGFGTRLAEETTVKPKPMVEIGGKPILWHIMNIYSKFGFNDFFLALGYKGEEIKKYFLDLYRLNSDFTIDLSNDRIESHGDRRLRWKVHLVDTGYETQTGGRIKRLLSWVGGERFMLTYGDGVADIDIRRLIAFHKRHRKLATVTAVRPLARFGKIVFKGDQVSSFTEKPQMGEGWINGGFFVLEPGIFDYIDDDETIWERAPLERLVEDGQLMAYKHEGFWQPMDTLRDKRLLDELWNTGNAPWKV